MELNNHPLWTALVTPLLEDGSVDFDSLKKILKEQEEAKNGVLVLGSTGESLNISLKERKEILEFATAQNLSVPLMVGVGGSNLEETKEWISYLNTQAVHCYLLVTPLYAKPGAKGQEQWFRALLDTATRPCMLYNIPSRTGIALNLDAYKNLRGHENLWALKEASGSADDFKNYVQANTDIDVFSGDDGMLPVFAKHGCKGLVSVASNVWPTETAKYVERTLAGELSEAEAKMWEECADSLFIASNPIPVKALMCELGTIKTNLMRAPLTHEDLASVSPLMASTDRVKEWSNK